MMMRNVARSGVESNKMKDSFTTDLVHVEPVECCEEGCVEYCEEWAWEECCENVSRHWRGSSFSGGAFHCS